MAKVWLDTGSWLAAPAAGAAGSMAVECLRLALAFEPGYFAFCTLDPSSGLRSVEEASVQAALERWDAQPIAVAAEPPAQGMRERAKQMITQLPVPLQAPAMAFGRAGARLLRGSEAVPSALPAAAPAVVPSPLGPEAPLGPADVFVPFSRLDAASRQLLGELREKMHFRVLAVSRRDTAAGAMRAALVMASEGGGGFEERLQHLYTSLLKAGDCCIDIGAHTGRHSLPMSQAVGAGGRVVAFEPNPPIAQRLRSRLQLLSVTNVAVHETALSDEAGAAEFVVAVDLPEESGLRERSIYNGPTRTERVTVQLAQLDSLHLASPRFIKLDTEGAEYKVLMGARETVARWRPVVAFEFGQASYAAYGVDPDDVFEYFASLDYQIFSILGERLSQPEFAQASRLQRYWDYVACDRAAGSRVASILQGFAAKA